MNRLLYIGSLFVFMAISAVIAFLWGYISCNLPVSGDDMFFGLYWNHSNIFGTLFGQESDFHGGKYLGLFLMRYFTVILPEFLHIHISDFYAKYISYINGFFAVFVMSSVIYAFSGFLPSKTLLLKRVQLKNLYFRHLLYFLLAVNIFSGLIYTPGAGILYCNYGYCRYFFSFLFFSFVVVYYLKIFMGKNVSKNEIILACLFSYITTTSIELLPVICVFLVLFTLFFKLTSKQKIIFLSDVLPLCVILLTALVLINPVSVQVAQERGMTSSALLKNHWVSLEYSFAKYFVKYYVLHFYWLWLSVLSLFLIQVKNAYSVRVKFFVFGFILSVLGAFSVLVLSGETYGGEIYLKHLNVRFLFYMLLLYPVNYLLMFIFNSRSQLSVFNRLFFVLIILFYVAVPAYNFKNTANLKYASSHNMEILRDNYVAEKLIRFYHLRHQVPIIPSLKGKPNEWNVLPFGTDYYKIKDNDYERQCFDNGVFMKLYYNTVYPNTTKYQQEYCVASDAVEVYKSNGGILTEEELNHPEFQKLYDDNFVLEN